MSNLLLEPELTTSAKSATSPYEDRDEKPDIFGSTLFIMVHLSCFLVFVVGFSWIALATCILAYAVRIFAITGGFHRYFSHRSYKTSRFFQFVLAVLGTSSAQQGPLWWAAVHRHHHKHSDTEEDVHSPVQRGFWWSHMGWVVCRRYQKTNVNAVPDLARFPELRFLDNYHMIPPVLLAFGIFMFGWLLGRYAPSLGTSGFQMLVWGFFVSTTALYHITFSINSLAHVVGKRRFDTKDESRNNLWLALITFGEGWHNNHHRWPASERQGFFWWEVDFTHYILRMLSAVGLVWDLNRPPQQVYAEAETLRKRQRARSRVR